VSDKQNRAVHDRIQNDLSYFTRRTLKIEVKEGGDTVPFKFNRAQEYLHKKLEAQKADTGWVRALIVKGRQQGCSTYVGGRFYHKALTQKGRRVFVMSHEAESTTKLFTMVETFYEGTPVSIQQEKDIDNTKHYRFAKTKSEYRVGTAGNANIGRGGTLQHFHGSEVAYWENTEGLETGILESVAELPGTEIILESTANGMGGFFYEQCMAAIKGQGDYQLIFIPWYWQDEYRRQVPKNFELINDESECKKLYGLDDEQIFWRRKKTEKFGRGEYERGKWKFMQEYPFHVMEAFQTSGDTLIGAQDIMKARKSKITDKYAPLIMGVDPGRHRDRTIFVYRRGREFLELEEFKFEDEDTVQMQIAGKIAKRIIDRGIDKVFVDVGEGHGVVDRLKELHYTNVQGIRFGENAIEDDIYANKRAEMWCLLRNWLEREDGEVSIPDEDIIQQDLTSMPSKKDTSNSKIQLVSKKEIRKKLKMSPDIADAMALTFAFPVQKRGNYGLGFQKIRKKNKARSPLSTVRRMKRYNETEISTNYYWDNR